MLIRRAIPIPTFCGSRTLRPQVGNNPTRAWVSAKRARSEPIRMSQYSASSSPPVTAAPLMAPITGLLIGGHLGEISGNSVVSPSSLRSKPAQNTGSAPVRITTSTPSSASASRRAAKNCVRSAFDNALRDSGRLSVRVRTRSPVSMSRMSAKMSDAMATPYRCRAEPIHPGVVRPRVLRPAESATRIHRVARCGWTQPCAGRARPTPRCPDCARSGDDSHRRSAPGYVTRR